MRLPCAKPAPAGRVLVLPRCLAASPALCGARCFSPVVPRCCGSPGNGWSRESSGKLLAWPLCHVTEPRNGLGGKGPHRPPSSNPLPHAGRSPTGSWVLRAPSSLAWDVPEDGASPTSLGNVGQGLPTLRVKNSFLRSDLNLPSVSPKPSPLVPSPPALVPAPLQLSCRPP